jgi:hypothetical protein
MGNEKTICSCSAKFKFKQNCNETDTQRKCHNPREYQKRASLLNPSPPRISPQNLKPFGLPQSLLRNLNRLRIENAPAPSTNRLEMVPSNLCNGHATAPAFALLLLKSLPYNSRTLLLETPRANPSSAVPLRRVRAFASARIVTPVELSYECRRDARQTVVAVSMPALCVLLHQRELIGVLVVSKADVKRLHTLVGHESHVVRATGRHVDFV